LGLISYWINYKLCCQIVNATAFEPNGLKHIEIWITAFQFKRWKKLVKISKVGSAELQAVAKKAMRFEVMFYFLFFTGMALLAIGGSA